MINRKERLITLIEEYWRTELPDTVKRDVEIGIETNLISDILGPRRAGKTFLMFLAIKKLLEKGVDKKQTVYVNFERRVLYPLTPEYFNHLIEIVHEEEILKNKVYFFLDEVQRVNNWEKFVRSIYDEFKGKIKIIISGSTSELTKSRLSYLLTGRHLTTFIFPLNFKEFLRFKNFTLHKSLTEAENIRLIKLLKEYIEFGGFPEVILGKNKEEYIETLFLDIINRDVAPKVREKEVLEDVAYFLASQSAKLTSFSKLVKVLKSRGVKISVPTLEKYFQIMKDAFMFFDTKIFSFKIKDQLQYPRKIYCIDTGFVNHFGFKFSEDKGRLIENLVALELQRRFPPIGKTKIFYWKDYQQREVDFLLKEGLKVKELIQVCWDVDDIETKEREVKNLVKAMKEFKLKEGLVITEDYEGQEIIERKRIVYVTLWKWLLK